MKNLLRGRERALQIAMGAVCVAAVLGLLLAMIPRSMIVSDSGDRNAPALLLMQVLSFGADFALALVPPAVILAMPGPLAARFLTALLAALVLWGVPTLMLHSIRADPAILQSIRQATTLLMLVPLFCLCMVMAPRRWAALLAVCVLGLCVLSLLEPGRRVPWLAVLLGIAAPALAAFALWRAPQSARPYLVAALLAWGAPVAVFILPEAVDALSIVSVSNRLVALGEVFQSIDAIRWYEGVNAPASFALVLAVLASLRGALPLAWWAWPAALSLAVAANLELIRLLPLPFGVYPLQGPGLWAAYAILPLVSGWLYLNWRRA